MDAIGKIKINFGDGPHPKGFKGFVERLGHDLASSSITRLSGDDPADTSASGLAVGKTGNAVGDVHERRSPDLESSGYHKYCRMVRLGTLPDDFDQWALTDEDDRDDGWTVAHEAACWGRLPVGFGRWELADEDGWTVAHEAAATGHLPPDFKLWDLADHNGFTVRDAFERMWRVI